VPGKTKASCRRDSIKTYPQFISTPCKPQTCRAFLCMNRRSLLRCILLILSVLSDAMPTLLPQSRRLNVVQDIVGSNDYQHLSDNKAEEIKRLLKGYTGMPGRLRQALIEFGFVITDEGKHYKLTYYGDGRYQTIFAKTPSDARAGKNNAATIVKNML
jgi:hypothetical protein